MASCVTLPCDHDTTSPNAWELMPHLRGDELLPNCLNNKTHSTRYSRARWSHLPFHSLQNPAYGTTQSFGKSVKCLRFLSVPKTAATVNPRRFPAPHIQSTRLPAQTASKSFRESASRYVVLPPSVGSQPDHQLVILFRERQANCQPLPSAKAFEGTRIANYDDPRRVFLLRRHAL